MLLYDINDTQRINDNIQVRNVKFVLFSTKREGGKIILRPSDKIMSSFIVLAGKHGFYHIRPADYGASEMQTSQVHKHARRFF